MTKTKMLKKVTASSHEKNIHKMEHPILQHLLTVLRDKTTAPSEFRRTMREMGRLVAYEASRDFKVRPTLVHTPLESTKNALIIDEAPIVISILRAGQGMLDGVLETLPFADVGHVGIYRDKKMKCTVEYFFRVPPHSQGRRVFLLDPLLATGDTAVAAIERLKEYGITDVSFLCILAAHQGIDRILATAPNTQIYTVSIERELNDKGYLLPGVGDAGDRLYGTE